MVLLKFFILWNYKILLIMTCYKLLFTFKEHDILHTQDTRLNSILGENFVLIYLVQLVDMPFRGFLATSIKTRSKYYIEGYHQDATGYKFLIGLNLYRKKHYTFHLPMVLKKQGEKTLHLSPTNSTKKNRYNSLSKISYMRTDPTSNIVDGTNKKST